MCIVSCCASNGAAPEPSAAGNSTASASIRRRHQSIGVPMICMSSSLSRHELCGSTIGVRRRVNFADARLSRFRSPPQAGRSGARPRDRVRRSLPNARSARGDPLPGARPLDRLSTTLRKGGGHDPRTFRRALRERRAGAVVACSRSPTYNFAAWASRDRRSAICVISLTKSSRARCLWTRSIEWTMTSSSLISYK